MTTLLDVGLCPAGTVLRGQSGIVYVRRPDEDVNRDGLGEWRATHGGFSSNFQVQKDAEVELVAAHSKENQGAEQ